MIICVVCLLVGLGGLLPAHSAQMSCPAPHPPVRDLDIGGYYRDGAKSVVDATAAARKQAAVKPLKDYLNQLAKFSDRANLAEPTSRREGFARCALAFLQNWAEGGAYLGRMTTKQAQAQRKWDLAGLALSYLKVRRFARPQERKSIELWLRTIADRARAVYDSPGKVRNNHWYWLGLGLAAVGIATDSPRHWDEARRIMRDAARDITADGLLPLELKRGRRALHYHTFSAMALVTLAELGKARGENWYDLGDAALHRLVRAITVGLRDPATFDKVAGIKQERPVKARAGWLQLYRARFANRLPNGLPRSKPKHRWLGGNVTALAKALGEL